VFAVAPSWTFVLVLLVTAVFHYINGGIRFARRRSSA